ncbi:hypothetical protein [Nocardioides acrostichi]|uniref:Uncharacterized protein n=1 Tax=Nocardioides acrostichi TaxID=2784339 RepID=A0A930YEU5_9ACTN|nr:hypothetical protein [Nocardioides acrostichi]MBF4163809.1 hypothetical protein [Nocardioides acrostichi]
MPRRVSLPGADDLFRPTTAGEQPAEKAPAEKAPVKKSPAKRAPAKPSGRVRHDEKMTVYVTSEELLALEQARLRLRSEHGLGVDRGRLVREAVALVLAEFEARGEDSALVRRLGQP